MPEMTRGVMPRPKKNSELDSWLSLFAHHPNEKFMKESGNCQRQFPASRRPATAFERKKDSTRILTCRQCLAQQRCYRHAHKEQVAQRNREYEAKHQPARITYEWRYSLTNKARINTRNQRYDDKKTLPMVFLFLSTILPLWGFS